MTSAITPDAQLLEQLDERVWMLQQTVAAFDDSGEFRTSLERQFHTLAHVAGISGLGVLAELARTGSERCAAGAGVAELRRVVAEIAARSYAQFT